MNWSKSNLWQPGLNFGRKPCHLHYTDMHDDAEPEDSFPDASFEYYSRLESPPSLNVRQYLDIVEIDNK